MSPASLLRSTSFRLIAWYAGMFVISVAILLSVVYWITRAALEHQLTDAVEREMTDADRARLSELLTAHDLPGAADRFTKISSGGKLHNFNKHEFEMWRAAL